MREMRSDVALHILGDAMLGNVASKSRAVAIRRCRAVSNHGGSVWPSFERGSHLR